MVYLDNLQKAIKKLEQALSWDKTEAHRDASILRFELCAELAWKTIRDYLKNEGEEFNTPLSVVRQAYRARLIEYDNDWIALIKDRNILVHIYNELKADKLYARLPKYLLLLQQLMEKLQSSDQNHTSNEE